MKTILLTQCLLALLIIGCSEMPTSSPDNSISNEQLEKKHPVPYRASISGGGAPPAPSTACDGLLLTEITGQGTATHIGMFTFSQSHCLDPNNFTFSNGWLEQTAANGDKLYGTYSGYLTPTSDPIIFQVTGAFEFNGGTGRFADAEGEGEASGLLDVTTGIVNLSLNGNIIY
ncbi:MAG: hypothetical protein R6W68_03220 [Ignavibacteriaceae bacterium]